RIDINNLSSKSDKCERKLRGTRGHSNTIPSFGVSNFPNVGTNNYHTCTGKALPGLVRYHPRNTRLCKTVGYKEQTRKADHQTAWPVPTTSTRTSKCCFHRIDLSLCYGVRCDSKERYRDNSSLAIL